jgi:hypothetical protein
MLTDVFDIGFLTLIAVGVARSRRVRLCVHRGRVEGREARAG